MQKKKKEKEEKKQKWLTPKCSAPLLAVVNCQQPCGNVWTSTVRQACRYGAVFGENAHDCLAGELFVFPFKTESQNDLRSRRKNKEMKESKTEGIVFYNLQLQQWKITTRSCRSVPTWEVTNIESVTAEHLSILYHMHSIRVLTLIWFLSGGQCGLFVRTSPCTILSYHGGFLLYLGVYKTKKKVLVF